MTGTQIAITSIAVAVGFGLLVLVLFPEQRRKFTATIFGTGFGFEIGARKPVRTDGTSRRSDGGAVTTIDQATIDKMLGLAKENGTLQEQLEGKNRENASLRDQLAAALVRVEKKGDAGDPAAQAAIAQARASGDAEQLQAVLVAEARRQEEHAREQARDYIELCREIAAIAYLRGDIKEARTRLQTILRLFPSDLGAITSMGDLHVLQGELDAATADYERVLGLTSDEEWRASAYGNLGLILELRNDLKGAEAMLRQALAIHQKRGDDMGVAAASGNLGLVLEALEDLPGAEAMHRASLAIHEKLGRQEQMATNYGNLGNVLSARKDPEGAEAMYRKALAIHEQLGHRQGMARHYGSLGNLQRVRGDLTGAKAMYLRSLELDTSLGHVYGMASTHANLGILAEIEQDLRAARERWKTARDLFQRVGTPHMVARMDEWLKRLPPE